MIKFENNIKKVETFKKKEFQDDDLITIISNKLGISLVDAGYERMTKLIFFKYPVKISKEDV